MVCGIVSLRADGLGNAGPGKRPADLGPVTGFVVFVSQIAQRNGSLLVRDAGDS
jgi:hypothetical protein